MTLTLALTGMSSSQREVPLGRTIRRIQTHHTSEFLDDLDGRRRSIGADAWRSPCLGASSLRGHGSRTPVAFDNGHPVVAYTDWATQTIWAWDPSSTPVNLNFQAAACDGGHGGLLCLIQSPPPFPLPPIPALKVVEFGAPDQQINTNATGVALDKYAAWRNVATGTIETMEFPFPATVTDSGLQGERPSVFAEFVAYQHNAGRDRRRRLRHFSGPELRS